MGDTPGGQWSTLHCGMPLKLKLDESLALAFHLDVNILSSAP